MPRSKVRELLFFFGFPGPFQQSLLLPLLIQDNRAHLPAKRPTRRQKNTSFATYLITMSLPRGE